MTDEPTGPAMGALEAGAMVAGSSAAVLVVELVALRLLAPYLGLTLETNTLVIGIALAAIATGSWVGGRAADLVPPRRTLGPLLAVSGVVVALTPVSVRGAGGADASLVLAVAALTLFVPAALLSAVTPMVTKLRLTDLGETGTVVGRLSGLSTIGAIAGTVLTGFVLISTVPVSVILVGLGLLLVAVAALVELRVRGPRAAVVPAALVGLGALAAVVAPDRCDAETVYHCAVVSEDPERPSGRVLELDTLRHSYVDLDDPTYLEFDYVRALASVADVAFPVEEPLDAYHLGGGGLTVPRYLAEVRPGTDSVVSEIDPGVVEIDEDRLGAGDLDGVEVRIEDGRLGVGALPSDSRDLVVGDAFAGVAVAWHLTTLEAVDEVDRVLRDDGVYAVNLIDHDPLAFARAEVATLHERFEHVVVAAEPETLARADGQGGNLVVAASHRPLDVAALLTAMDARGTGWELIEGDDVDDWVGDAEVLTDDDAPVDQLVNPYSAPTA